MQYMGGKSRIAGEITCAIVSEAANRGIPLQRVVSLFCGACSAETRLAKYADLVVCNDLNPYLIAMWQEAQDGRVFPGIISESDYAHIRSHKDDDPALAGFAGFACSFGGKWFAGYARGKYNYADVGQRSIVRDATLLQNAVFTCKDYREVEIQPGDIVYADPPYAGTTGYGDRFDTDAFWDYMRRISQTNLVFISEQAAPDDFVSIWEKQQDRILDSRRQMPTATERLYIHTSV